MKLQYKTDRHRPNRLDTSERIQINLVNCKSQENFRPSQDIFSSFLYRDHVTRYQYEFSKLKNMGKLKTAGDQHRKSSNKQLEYYSQELNMLKKIKQNRNLELCARNKGSKIVKESCVTQSNEVNHWQVQKIKNKLRKQVHSLNHQFLRQYLYHNQPFNKMLVQINQYSNTGLINQTRINELKEKILECMRERNNEKKSMQRDTTENKKQSEKKVLKQLKQMKIDKKFEKIWDTISKQIRAKVKMEGEYNIKKLKHNKTMG